MVKWGSDCYATHHKVHNGHTHYLLEPSRLRLKNTPTAFLQRNKTPPKSVLDMTLNILILGLKSWSIEECRVPLQCHRFNVYSVAES